MLQLLSPKCIFPSKMNPWDLPAEPMTVTMTPLLLADPQPGGLFSWPVLILPIFQDRTKMLLYSLPTLCSWKGVLSPLNSQSTLLSAPMTSLRCLIAIHMSSFAHYTRFLVDRAFIGFILGVAKASSPACDEKCSDTMFISPNSSASPADQPCLLTSLLC